MFVSNGASGGYFDPFTGIGFGEHVEPAAATDHNEESNAVTTEIDPTQDQTLGPGAQQLPLSDNAINHLKSLQAPQDRSTD